ncbi:hypothetical protein CYMTET_3794 [Cymbomonas tetramitiformis]|uniref:Probable magnesium transporter n=1 Tax=Cymbomonas tetramitiformis TaxID=36881 RepID=A0AAE0LL05_9CHLO|nr:hypothetical protein CYMTET_3794 [Cymbomonas tetramitiformis]
MWVAVLLAVLASAGNNLGKALQKKAVRGLPRLVLDRKVLKQYLMHRTWVIGLFADVGGALLNIAAIARAPVSLVQPIMSSGLAFLALFAHFYLEERLQSSEWGAITLVGFGILGMGLSAEKETEDVRILPLRILVTTGVGMTLLLACSVYLHQHSGRHRESSMEELISGAQAGICFGLSTSMCRTGMVVSRVVGWMGAVAGLCLSVVLTTWGLMCQTEALKDGRAVMVCTAAGAAALVTGLVYGAVALDEALPKGRTMLALRLSSLLFTVVGIISLHYCQAHPSSRRQSGSTVLPHRNRPKISEIVHP